MIDSAGIKGFVTIKEFSKETGEMISEWTEQNVVTNEGMKVFMERLAFPDENEDRQFDRYVLGNDISDDGDSQWTDLNPQPAKATYTKSDQSTVYEVPSQDMIFSQESNLILRTSSLLDGEQILDTFFQDDPDIKYTSITLRFKNDTVFAYKRFPARSLSRLIDVFIEWSFILDNKEDFCEEQ